MQSMLMFKNFLQTLGHFALKLFKVQSLKMSPTKQLKYHPCHFKMEKALLALNLEY